MGGRERGGEGERVRAVPTGVDDGVRLEPLGGAEHRRDLEVLAEGLRGGEDGVGQGSGEHFIVTSKAP